MHQFHIEKSIPLELGGFDISISNAVEFIILAAAIPAAFFLFASARQALVPARLQMLGENIYNFVYDNLYGAAGEKGVKMFMPLVMALFLFIACANVVSLWAYNFAPTGQLVIPATMAILVFATVILVGFFKHGLGFFKLFFPSGVPWPLYFIVTPIEIISFFSRPLSHSVRLWANIFAGHILVKVFAGFVPAMASVGAIGIFGAILPFGMTIALYALETLVAVLQAYVFVLLACIYFNDALHAGDH